MPFEHLPDDGSQSAHRTLRWRLAKGEGGDLLLQVYRGGQQQWTTVLIIDASTGRLIRVYNEGGFRACGLPVDVNGKIVVV